MFEILLIFIPSFLFEENAFLNAAFKIHVNCASNFFILIWWDFVARFMALFSDCISPIFCARYLNHESDFDILAKLIYL